MTHELLSCSFCGKSQREVLKLIAGPAVYICDECIGLCNDIMAEERAVEEKAEADSPGGEGGRPRLDVHAGEGVVSESTRRRQLAWMALELASECRADPGLPKVIGDMAVTIALALEPPKEE